MAATPRSSAAALTVGTVETEPEPLASASCPAIHEMGSAGSACTRLFSTSFSLVWISCCAQWEQDTAQLGRVESAAFLRGGIRASATSQSKRDGFAVFP
eukprot:2668729-Prymnesium_polylepis.1